MILSKCGSLKKGLKFSVDFQVPKKIYEKEERKVSKSSRKLGLFARVHTGNL